MKLLGLTGPAGVGKDTAAVILSGYGYEPYAMAKPLKEMLAVAGLPEPADREAKELPFPGRSFSYRVAAQTLGTEWGRGLEPDFWLRIASKRIAGKAMVVVTDIRFEDEAAWLRAEGGTLVHVYGRQSTVSGEAAKHVSENGVFKKQQDRLLCNDGSLQVLNQRVFELLRQL